MLNALDDDVMIIIILQPAHHDHAHNALHVLHPHRKAPSVKRIHARISHLEPVPQRVLRRPGRMALLQAQAHPQRRHPPPQHDRLLALHQVHHIWTRARSRRRKKEQLERVGVRDVDDRGAVLRAPTVCADGRAELPCDVAVERGEHARVFLRLDGLDLCASVLDVVRDQERNVAPTTWTYRA